VLDVSLRQSRQGPSALSQEQGGRRLSRKAFIGLVALFVVMVALLFGGAGTFDYWQAWLFLAVYFGASFAITLYLVRRDPALLARRMRGGPWAERQPAQRVIMVFTSLAFIGLTVLPALDRRFGWSHISGAVAVLGDVLVALGWLGIYRVFRENSFTSATIELAPDQRVISTGPYALVRHPMYATALIMLLGSPIALGSWWGVLGLFVITPALIWRIVDEENFLAVNLPGYSSYKEKVRYRLIPHVW
jgi:protein-S-isoprenylcysteine O-methyltransferase Ste14